MEGTTSFLSKAATVYRWHNFFVPYGNSKVMPTKKQTTVPDSKAKKTTTIVPKKKAAVAKKTPTKTDSIILPVMPLLEI